MKVRELMSAPVLVVKPTDTLAHAKRLMLRGKVKRLVVMERGRVVGLLTVRDIVSRLRAGSPSWRLRTWDNGLVSRVMSREVHAVSPGTDVNKAVVMMLDRDVSSLVVLDGERLVGILTKTDVVRHFSGLLGKRFKVRELMSRDVVTVNRRQSVARIVEMMEECNVRSVVVTEGKKPVGVIMDRDLAFAQLEHPEKGVREREVRYTRKVERGGRPRGRYVKYVALLTADDIMRRDPVTVYPDADAAEAAALMMESGMSGIPVVEGEELVGIVTKTDLLRGIRRAGFE
ncbi:MAG: CBS domain-containing protein [Candidatus Hadarchaeum sp.]|uniref:CBS domain-containing protein n=1 Tax=Candidatus Hadarchaeum sp. TaxID=2883567 RepID=UPI003D0BFC53